MNRLTERIVRHACGQTEKQTNTEENRETNSRGHHEYSLADIEEQKVEASGGGKGALTVGCVKTPRTRVSTELARLGYDGNP